MSRRPPRFPPFPYPTLSRFIRRLMTGASAAVGGDTPTDTWQRTSTPASTIGPWLPEGDLGARLAGSLGRGEEALRTAVGSEHQFVRGGAGDPVAAGGQRLRPPLAPL